MPAFGDFSGRATGTVMQVRNSKYGAFEKCTTLATTLLATTLITSETGIGQVGLEWTIAGFGDFIGNAKWKPTY